MARLVSIDLAKGLTVLFIPAIHVVMLYSNLTVHHSAFSIPFRFIAEWPGAQLLMFLMAMTFSFSKKPTPYHIKKALLVFIAGYLLNVFKFLLPHSLECLPQSFIHDLDFSHRHLLTTNLVLLGDIFHFAGIALLILTVLKQFRYYAILGAFIACFFIIASPLFWDWHHKNIFVDHLLHLLGGKIPDAFFPLMPWLVYPLVGLSIGNYLQTPYCSVEAISFTGIFLLLSGFSMQFLPLHFPGSLFWRTYPDKTIMHLGFVMFWVSMWLWMEPHIKKYSKNYFVRILSFCSRHITIIYLLQWIIIFWMLPLFGYYNLDIGETIITIPFIYFIIFLPIYIFQRRS